MPRKSRTDIKIESMSEEFIEKIKKITIRIEGVTLNERQRQITYPYLNMHRSGKLTWGQFTSIMLRECRRAGVPIQVPNEVEEEEEQLAA